MYLTSSRNRQEVQIKYYLQVKATLTPYFLILNGGLSMKLKLLLSTLMGVWTLLLVSSIALAAGPTVEIVAPSNEVGDAGAALGNVWDMNDLDDVTWSQPNSSGQTVSYSIDASPLDTYGLALRGSVPSGSDLATAFYTNADQSIPGTVYKYLVYRSLIAPWYPGEGGIVGGATNGRVLYSSQWGNDWFNQAFPFRRNSKPYLIHEQETNGQACTYGQWCVIYLDLTQQEPFDLNGQFSPNPWNWGEEGADIEAFGLWPHETWAGLDGGTTGNSPDFFYIDYVYLLGDVVTSVPANGSTYTIRWQVSDTDGGIVQTTLYYQESDEILVPAAAPTCDSTLAGWTAIPGGTSSIDLGGTGGGDEGDFRLYLPGIQQSIQTTPTPTPTPDPGDGTFGSGVIGASNQSFTWSLAGSAFTEGKVYYVCAVVEDDTGLRAYAVSDAPVVKVPRFATLRVTD